MPYRKSSVGRRPCSNCVVPYDRLCRKRVWWNAGICAVANLWMEAFLNIYVCCVRLRRVQLCKWAHAGLAFGYAGCVFGAALQRGGWRYMDWLHMYIDD